MNSFETHEIGRDIVARYREKTSRSEKHFREAQRWLPGGETRRASFFSPYPIFMESSQERTKTRLNSFKTLKIIDQYTARKTGR